MRLPKAYLKQLGLTAKRKRPREPKAKRKPLPLVGPAGSWTIVVPRYLPPSLSELLHVHWRTKHKLKKECAQFVGWHGRHIPKATGKRRVLLTLVRVKGMLSRDNDNSHKAVLDALVQAELLGDDSPDWVVCPPPIQLIGETREMRIEIEELAE